MNGDSSLSSGLDAFAWRDGTLTVRIDERKTLGAETGVGVRR